MAKHKKQKKIDLKISLPANIYLLSGVRNLTLAFIQNVMKLKEPWPHRMQTVVDELCSNAMEYGSKVDAKIELIYRYTADKKFEIIVQDTGTKKLKITARQLKKQLKKRTEKNQNNIRGRGLAIIKKWTDKLKITKNKKGGIKITGIKYL